MLDDDFKTPQRNPMQIGIIAVICGLIGVVCCFLIDGIAIVGVLFGAVGLFVGGYGINYANHVSGNDRTMAMAASGVGLLISIFAFMFGLVMSV